MNSNELVDKMETLAIKRGMQARIDELGHALAKAQAERDEWQSAHSIRSDELDGAIGMLNEARARVAELEQDKARLEGNLAHAHYVKIDSLLAERAQLNEALTIAEGALNATLWRDLPDDAVLQVKIALAAIDAAKGQP